MCVGANPQAGEGKWELLNSGPTRNSEASLLLIITRISATCQHLCQYEDCSLGIRTTKWLAQMCLIHCLLPHGYAIHFDMKEARQSPTQFFFFYSVATSGCNCLEANLTSRRKPGKWLFPSLEQYQYQFASFPMLLLIIEYWNLFHFLQ